MIGATFARVTAKNPARHSANAWNASGTTRRGLFATAAPHSGDTTLTATNVSVNSHGSWSGLPPVINESRTGRNAL